MPAKQDSQSTLPAKARLARVVVLVCVIASSACLVMCTTAPPVGQQAARPSPQTRAALSYRDHVSPFEKYGSKLFMAPILKRQYAKTMHITQPARHRGRAHFIRSLTTLLKTHDVVDVFLAAHGNAVYRWVEAIKPELRQKLRLIYNTGCANAWQSKRWLNLGAKAYVGHPGRMSISPVFLVLFMRDWVNGYALVDAVQRSNQRAARRLRFVGDMTFGRISGQWMAKQTHATLHAHDRSMTIHTVTSSAKTRP